MKSDPENTRRRQIRWSSAADAEAVKLAHELGYYPEKQNGGVSKMLADLVKKAGPHSVPLYRTPQDQKKDYLNEMPQIKRPFDQVHSRNGKSHSRSAM